MKQTVGWSLLLLVAVPAPALAWDADFSGWVDFAMEASSDRDMEPHFDQSHLYLIGDARVNKQWSVFSVVEFEHLPETSTDGAVGTIKLERSYLQYETPRSRLRMGRMATDSAFRSQRAATSP